MVKTNYPQVNLMPLRLFIVLFSLLMVNPLLAQDETDYQIITADNISDLQMVGLVGRGGINDFAWSSDSSTILVSSPTGLWLYDPLELERTPELFEPTGYVTVAYSPDGRYLAVGSTSGSSMVTGEVFGTDVLKVWDLNSGEMMLEADASTVNVAFFPNRPLLLTVNSLSGLELWNLETGERVVNSQYLIPEFATHSFGTDIALAFSPDGAYFAAVTLHRGRDPFRWSNEDILRRYFIYEGERAYIWSTQAVLDQNHIAPDTVETTIAVTEDWITRTGLSPNGMLQANWGAYQLTVRDAGTLEEISTLNAHNDWVISIAFHPNGHEVAFYNSNKPDDLIRLWDTEKLQLRHILEPNERSGSSVLYSPDGRLLASGTTDFDGNIHIWDVLTGDRLATYELEKDYSFAYPSVFTADSHYLFVRTSGTSDKLFTIDLIKQEVVAEFEMDDIKLGIAMSPDESSIALVVRDRAAGRNKIQVWEIAYLDNQISLDLERSWELDFSVNNLQYVTDTTLIFERTVSDYVTTVSLFDLETGVETQLEEVDPSRLDSSLYSPSLNANRTLLAVATRAGMRFWDMNTMLEIDGATIPGDAFAMFSRDGKSLLSVHGLHGGLRMWRVPVSDDE